MKLDLVKSKNGYRIISRGNRKHPALKILAEFIRESNKFAPVKIGIFSVSSAEFSSTKRVYSYLSGKTELMSKVKYFKWKQSKRQMQGAVQSKSYKKLLKDWVLENGLECVMDDEMEKS